MPAHFPNNREIGLRLVSAALSIAKYIASATVRAEAGATAGVKVRTALPVGTSLGTSIKKFSGRKAAFFA
jgi:hypothetical protein